jgi:hypothetical protein
MAALGWLCVVLLCTSCLGPGHATARLYKFNRNIENKWGEEGVFILLLPAYVVTSAADNFIWNSIQWWTGKNPVDPPEGSPPSEFGL